MNRRHLWRISQPGRKSRRWYFPHLSWVLDNNRFVRSLSRRRTLSREA